MADKHPDSGRPTEAAIEAAVEALIADSWEGHDEELTRDDLALIATVVLGSAEPAKGHDVIDAIAEAITEHVTYLPRGES